MVIIIGAGVSGLGAANVLNEHSIVLERDSKPGGLVQSLCFDGGFWFDKVLHLLHFSDVEIQQQIMVLENVFLQSCKPDARIVCTEGVVHYPFQLNLGGLNESAKLKCIEDFANVYFGHPKSSDSDSLHYRDFLIASFGKAMCEIFFFPYNEKLWKYPLTEISNAENKWNIHRPDFREVLRGAFRPAAHYETYNSNAFYPRPPAGAPVRGMELLSLALAKKISNLKLNHKVLQIDPAEKCITVQHHDKILTYRYQAHCLSTMPLPALMNCCTGVPSTLMKQVAQLRSNCVLSIGLSIIGRRPVDTGHWRYYTDPDIPFTRLVFMTAFDPFNAPENGWSLLVEMTWPSQKPLPEKSALFDDIEKALKKLQLLDGGTIIGKHLWIADPAYVIFTPENNKIVNNCKDYLHTQGIQTLGRYGNWEYSSMFQNIREGKAIGNKILKCLA